MKGYAVFFLITLVFTVVGFLGFVLAGGSIAFALTHITLALLSLAMGALLYLKSMRNAKRRHSLKVFNFKRILTVLSFCCALLFLIGLNYWAAKSAMRLDLTEAGVYSLSDESISLLNEMGTNIQFFAVQSPEGQEHQKELELLEKYRIARPDIVSVKFFNPLEEPQYLRAYNFASSDKLAVVIGNQEALLLDEISEPNVTSALAKNLRSSERTIYFLAGHGEGDFKSVAPNGFSKLGSALASEQYSIEQLLLGRTGSVPENARALTILNPVRSIPKAELVAIKDYMKRGGDLIVFTEPQNAQFVSSITSPMGLTVGSEVILEHVQQIFKESKVSWQITSRSYGEHVATHGLSDSELSVFVMAAPVHYSEKARRTNSIQPIISSNNSAWLEKDLSLFTESVEPKILLPKEDQPQQFPIIASAIRLGEDKTESRMLVGGDTSWLENQNFNFYANEILARRLFSWANEENQSFVSRPRSFRKSILLLSSSVFKSLLSSSFVISEVIFLFGLAVWWRRNHGNKKLKGELAI